MTANTRDGVDTRNKDLTIRLGRGDQERVGQTAALYLVPPGAEIKGSPMNAYWTNYVRLADSYVNKTDDFFIFVSYEMQQSYNEKLIQCECDVISEDDGVLNMYRQNYNSAITKYRRYLSSSDLEDAMEYLAEFNEYQKEILCACCHIERRIGFVELCPDCYYSGTHPETCYMCNKDAYDHTENV